jgi:hypothetical protein
VARQVEVMRVVNLPPLHQEHKARLDRHGNTL